MRGGGNLQPALLFAYGACPSVPPFSHPSLPLRQYLRGGAVESKLLCTNKKASALLSDRSCSGCPGPWCPPLPWPHPTPQKKRSLTVKEAEPFRTLLCSRVATWLLPPYTGFSISSQSLIFFIHFCHLSSNEYQIYPGQVLIKAK